MSRTTLIAFAAAVIGVVSPAIAEQQLCTERKAVVTQLSKQYSEAPVAMGLANNGGLLEILSSDNGQSWTIILTMPNGISCMIAAGESWEALPDIVRKGPPA